MIRHYLVSAFRQIAKSKGVFAANVFGFTLNFIVVIFGLNYVLFEMSFDGYHEKGDRIYRVLATVPDFGNEKSANTSGPLAPTLAEAFPEVEAAVRVYYMQSMEFRASPSSLSESSAFNIAYVDPGYFRVFSHGPVPEEAIEELAHPHTAVISQTVANRFFGDEDPTGRLLYVRSLSGQNVVIVGVMEDVPRNTHLRPDVIISFETVPNNMIAWGGYQFLTYVLLTDNREETFHNIRAKLEDFPLQYLPDIQSGNSYDLEPLSEVYFSPNAHWRQVKGDLNYVYFALAYLVLISFMTVANYLNINIAYLVRRVKETGLRKSYGASRIQVICQFVVEILMNCLAAIGISIVCVLLIMASQLPILANLSGFEISYGNIGAMGLAFLVIGFVSSICPALVFYGINPVDMLSNRVTTTWSANSLRKGLLFFQLAISVVLLLLTSLFFNQVTFLTDKSLGYEKENKIIVPLVASYDWHRRLAERFVRHPQVKSVSSAWGYPGRLVGPRVYLNLPGSDMKVRLHILTVGRGFLKTMKMEMVHGREFVADEFGNAVLLNVSAFNALGLDVEDLNTEQEIAYELVRVVGVVSDFHTQSLHHEIEPVMLKHRELGLTHLIVDIGPSNQEETLEHISSIFRDLLPDNRFEYFFLDEKLDELYTSDRQILETLLLLALIAFALAVAGIYNYGVFFTLNRIREVAIRKIHGASAGDIVRMNITAISKSIGPSLVIALPFVYWVYGQWIAQYAYRADVSPLLVVLPLLAIYVLTCIMVTRETLKTAGMTPAEVIRNVQQ